MIVEYSALPETAKVWVYPSNRKFYDTEIDGINEKIKTFLESWKSDDEDFKVSYQFLYNRFTIGRPHPICIALLYPTTQTFTEGTFP